MIGDNRIPGLDVFRGWGIVLMIVFHFSYDLRYFHLADIDIIHGTLWAYFRYLIVSIFMVSVGVSLGIVHGQHIRWHKAGKRALILAVAAVSITIVTRIQSPYAWVYFGILHLIFVSSLVGLMFVHHPRVALVSAMVIFVLSVLDMTGQHWLFYKLQPIFNLPYSTEDLAYFFPWFGAVLIGLGGYGLGWHNTFFSTPFLSSKNTINNILSFLGYHSLTIYLLHLPVLYATLMAIAKMIQ